jgi:hypothetical protein
VCETDATTFHVFFHRKPGIRRWSAAHTPARYGFMYYSVGRNTVRGELE